MDARSACGGAAGSVARVSVSRREASGLWPAGRGRARAVHEGPMIPSNDTLEWPGCEKAHGGGKSRSVEA